MYSGEKMPSFPSCRVSLTLLIFAFVFVANAAPQNRGNRFTGGGNRNQGATRTQTAQGQAAQVAQGVSRAGDGSMIIDMTANVNNLPLRFKVSAPDSQFVGQNGATAQSGNTTMGLNVLLHGDGGQSFFDFPNQNVQNNLMGVAVLAPDPNLFWGGGAGLQRTDGVAHSQAVSDLITQVMPQIVNFDSSQVFFTGVSGGSLMLSGFFIPQQMQNFPNSGVLLNCGALPPQVDFVDPQVLTTTTIHYQSTQNELADLQESIPQAIDAYAQATANQGLSNAQIDQLQTVNNSPNGGHCEFDEQGFVSGVQLMADSYSNVIQQGGNGQVNGIGNVRTGVTSSGPLTFGPAPRQ